jgi:choline dehydrogenase-like flavoprotein
MSDLFDVIVVGSGPAAVHAAYPLVEAGRRVAMVDGGQEPSSSLLDAPALSYEDMRRTCKDQYRWFLGDDYSGIPLDEMNIGQRGSIVSGQRNFVVSKTNERLPVRAYGAQIIQSLAKGGLCAAWGGVCAYYSKVDLEALGLPPEEMNRHYDLVTQRVGVSGPPTRPGVQPPVRLDHHASRILETYERKKSAFDAMHVTVSQPHSAVLTEDRGARKATAYRDMDYWLDSERSVYRPRYTLEELQSHPNFVYIGGRVVQRVVDKGDGCEVQSISLHSKDTASAMNARIVIMAGGAVGTARILLRSLELYDQAIPFLAKPHWLVACLHPKTLGMAGIKERLSLCQLLVTDEKRSTSNDYLSAGYAQLYSYKSLGLIRMLGFLPIPIPEALDFLSLLVPSMVIADIRFPHFPSAHKSLKLVRTERGEDLIQIRMEKEPAEFDRYRESKTRLLSALKSLGLVPIREKLMPYGSTGHYGGTVPFSSSDSIHALSVDGKGRLRQARHIYVADSSVFPFLPAKSICMTIMANANRVGEEVRRSLDTHT